MLLSSVVHGRATVVVLHESLRVLQGIAKYEGLFLVGGGVDLFCSANRDMMLIYTSEQSYNVLLRSV
jgi:hypothetical protein